MERRRFLASALVTGTLAATAPGVAAAQRKPAAGDRSYMILS